jgi:hypothetical protein
MGIGSPRLLRKLFARTIVLLVVALIFAPPALADDVVSVGVAAGPVSATVSVPAPATPAAPAAPAAPATPVTPAVDSAQAAIAPVAASVPPTVVGSPASVGARPEPLVDRVVAPPRPVAPAERTRTTTPQRAARAATSRAPLRRDGATGSTTAVAAGSPETSRIVDAAAAGPARPTSSPSPRPPLPQPPAPLPADVGGAAGGGTGAGIALLLLALAAEAISLVPPRLRRRLRDVLGSVRPYPFLLRLERPD